MPPKPIRDLRLLTRYRRTQIAERRREAQRRLHKALEDTGIKLDCVASDILGKSGRAMLDALIGGTTDPEVLAELARGKLRKKIPALREALQGRFEALHALLIGAIVAHLDFLDEQITQLSEAIEAQIAPFAAARELLMTIPGVGQRTAEVIIAEIGTDMTVFPSAGHLASWAGQCPGNDQSAGKRRSGRTRKGSKHLNAALKDAAMAVEFPRFCGHLIACAAKARKDGVFDAENPTRIPRAVPSRGRGAAAGGAHPERAGPELGRVPADAAELASPGPARRR